MVLDKDIHGKRPRGRPRVMDGQYEESYENIWPGRPNDGTQEGVTVFKDSGNGRHSPVYKTHCEKVRRITQGK